MSAWGYSIPWTFAAADTSCFERRWWVCVAARSSCSPSPLPGFLNCPVLAVCGAVLSSTLSFRWPLFGFQLSALTCAFSWTSPCTFWDNSRCNPILDCLWLSRANTLLNCCALHLLGSFHSFLNRCNVVQGKQSFCDLYGLEFWGLCIISHLGMWSLSSRGIWQAWMLWSIWHPSAAIEGEIIWVFHNEWLKGETWWDSDWRLNEWEEGSSQLMKNFLTATFCVHLTRYWNHFTFHHLYFVILIVEQDFCQDSRGFSPSIVHSNCGLGAEFLSTHLVSLPPSPITFANTIHGPVLCTGSCFHSHVHTHYKLKSSHQCTHLSALPIP